MCVFIYIYIYIYTHSTHTHTYYVNIFFILDAINHLISLVKNNLFFIQYIRKIFKGSRDNDDWKFSFAITAINDIFKYTKIEKVIYIL